MDLYRKLLILLLTAGTVAAQTGSIFVDENHNNHKIFGLPTPSASNEAATKGYVDSSSGGGAVTSVFTRTGAVVAATNDYTFSQIGSKPTTLAGYGITDAQPLDGDLTAIAALTGTNTIYYRSASNIWSPVTIGSNMTFSAGTLNAVAGGSGTVTTTGSPATGQMTKFSGGTSITNAVAGTDYQAPLTTTTVGLNFLDLTNPSAVTFPRINADNSVSALSAGAFLTAIGGGTGNGSVTNFSAGTLSPLFTTSVATSTTTPALSFSLSTAAANSWFGNATGSITAPAFNTSVFPAALMPALTGDVTTSAGAVATTIGAGKVTYAKMQNVSANSVLLGSNATGSGSAPSEITLGTNLSMSGSTLNAAGGGGGNVSNSGTPVSGQIPIWTSATAIKGDTGLTYTGTGTSALLDIGGTDLGLARNAASVLEVNNGTAGLPGGLKVGTRDAGTTTVPDGLVLWHNTTSAANTGFGESIAFTADTNGANNQTAGRISAAWSVATNASRTAYMDFQVETGAGANQGSVMRLFGEGSHGSMTVGNVTTDPGATGYINASGGYWVGDAASTGGKIMQSDGNKFTASTATWPTTNTNGYKVQGTGTNYVAYPTDIESSSTATVSSSYAADTYLAGSTITVAAGDWKAQGQYHCRFDMTKTAAGTATPIISVRMGTAGTTSDTAVGTLTFAVGTGVADTGIFDVDVVFRSVGSGTSAVVQMMGECGHGLAATGLTTTGAAGTAIIIGTSSGFASTTQTKIGLSFNGGSSFVGTNTIVIATLHQP